MRNKITHLPASVLLMSLLNFSLVQGFPSPASLPQNVSAQTNISFRLKATLNRQQSKVLRVFLNSDGSVLAVATENKKTELWNTESGKLIASLDSEIFLPFYQADNQSIAAFTEDGRTIATINGKVAKLWEASTGQLKHVLKGHEEEISSTAFSPDSKSLATFSADGIVKLWNVETGQPTATLVAYRVKKLPRWRIISRTFGDTSAFGSIYFSPDNRTVLTAPYGQATKLWDATTGQLKSVLGEKNLDAQFSPSGRYVLTRREDFTTTDLPADLWETNTGRLIATLALPYSYAEFSHDEQWLGPVHYRDRRGLLNLKTMQAETHLVGSGAFTSWLLFSPDDRIFLSASGLNHHTATLVEVATGKELASFPIVAKEGFDFISDYLKYVERLSFHPSGQVLMGANKNLVRFWDVQSGRQIKEIAEGRDPAVFSRDGKLLVMASSDKKNVLLWEVKL